MQRKTGVTLVVIILCAAIAAFFFFRRAEEIMQPPQPLPPPVAAVEAMPPAQPITPMAPETPAIEHPLEMPPTAEALPPLDQSDAMFLTAISPVLGESGLAALLPEDLIRRIVVTVDNLPGQKLPAKLLPLKPVPEAFITTGEGESRFIGALNAARYAAYVQLARAVNPDKLVSVYAQFYPLFQRAYEDLGYPKAYFNDRLVTAIDDLLATPEVEEPIRVVQPKIFFQFADADLVERSAGQKILLRMGRENAVAIKARLREIRRLVVKPT